MRSLCQDGIRYYERGFDKELYERTGADNPFDHIRALPHCSDLSVADWDGDGDLDLLVSSPLLPMRYFQQSDGSLVPVDDDKNPFRHILPNTTLRRPLMADWNGDGRMDLLLLPKIFERLIDDQFCNALEAELGNILFFVNTERTLSVL